MWNADGDALVQAQNVNGNLNFKNNWAAGGGVGFSQREFDDRLTRGGPGAYANGYKNFWSWVNTDNRKRVSMNMFNGAGRNGVGGWFRDHEMDLTFRPMSALTLSSGYRINRAVSEHQWVELVTDSTNHYVFANINQTTFALTERLNYTMTPTLSLQLYAQPFVSGGEYRGFKELANGRSLDYDGRYSPYAYQSNPDFNYKSFRTTNVLRWEYKPGSTVFVVWQQSRDGSETYGDVRINRDFGRIFNTPAHNVVLVKFSYWLNY